MLLWTLKQVTDRPRAAGASKALSVASRSTKPIGLLATASMRSQATIVSAGLQLLSCCESFPYVPVPDAVASLGVLHMVLYEVTNEVVYPHICESSELAVQLSCFKASARTVRCPFCSPPLMARAEPASCTLARRWRSDDSRQGHSRCGRRGCIAASGSRAHL